MCTKLTLTDYAIVVKNKEYMIYKKNKHSKQTNKQTKQKQKQKQKQKTKNKKIHKKNFI
jgi:hypothetical protein